jgi:hypothetical protein
LVRAYSGDFIIHSRRSRSHRGDLLQTPLNPERRPCRPGLRGQLLARTPTTKMGREQEASELIEAAVQMAPERGTGRLVGFAAHASAVLDNGLGRYDAARRAFERDQPGLGPLVVAELAEAAARTGDVGRQGRAGLAVRTHPVTPAECPARRPRTQPGPR